MSGITHVWTCLRQVQIADIIMGVTWAYTTFYMPKASPYGVADNVGVRVIVALYCSVPLGDPQRWNTVPLIPFP